ncbi:MAG: O-antigen ligase family protein [Phycisphaerae bacterium]
MAQFLFYWIVAVLSVRPLLPESFERVYFSFLGAIGVPPGPTPGTSALLDSLLLAASAAALALRSVGRVDRVVLSGIGLLAAASLVSTIFADDKRVALNASTNLLITIVAIIALRRLMTARWMPALLLAAALASGVANTYQCYVQKFVDFPATIEDWEKNQRPKLARQGYDLSEPSIVNFERRMRSAETYGHLSHPNVQATCLSMWLLTALGGAAACAGFGAPKTPSRGPNCDRGGAGNTDSAAFPLAAAGTLWAAGVFATLAVAAAGAVWFTGSLGAILSTLVGVGVLILLYLLRDAAARRPGRAILLGAALYVAIVGAGVAYGRARGTLPHPSLAFRWMYWTAAAQIYAESPLTGIGRENFRDPYLRYKAIEATEEVQNPHNLWVALLVDYGPLGLIGGVILLAWTLRRILAGAEACDPNRDRKRAGIEDGAARGTTPVTDDDRAMLPSRAPTVREGSAQTPKPVPARKHASAPLSDSRELGERRPDPSLTVGAWMGAHSGNGWRGVLQHVAIPALVLSALHAFGAKIQLWQPGVGVLWLVELAGLWFVACALLFAAMNVALADSRSRACVVIGVVAALAAVLLHALIDFTLLTAAGGAILAALAAGGLVGSVSDRSVFNLASPIGQSPLESQEAGARSVPPETSQKKSPQETRQRPVPHETGQSPVQQKLGSLVIAACVVIAHAWLVAVPTMRSDSLLESMQNTLAGASGVGDLDRAIELGEQFVDADRWNPDSPRVVARMLLEISAGGVEQGPHQLAALQAVGELLEVAILRNPRRSSTWRMLGECEERVFAAHQAADQQQAAGAAIDRAARAWARAAELDPNNPRTQLEAGMIWHRRWQRGAGAASAVAAQGYLERAKAIDATRAADEAVRFTAHERQQIDDMLAALAAGPTTQP